MEFNILRNSNVLESSLIKSSRGIHTCKSLTEVNKIILGMPKIFRKSLAQCCGQPKLIKILGNRPYKDSVEHITVSQNLPPVHEPVKKEAAAASLRFSVMSKNINQGDLTSHRKILIKLPD